MRVARGIDYSIKMNSVRCCDIRMIFCTITSHLSSLLVSFQVGILELTYGRNDFSLADLG